METNNCSNCDYALKTTTVALRCIRHNMYVSEENICPGYFNSENLTKEGK